MLLRLVRRAATLPGLRLLTRSAAVLRVTYALRAALVADSGRFAANELRRGATVETYRLRHSDVRVALRHHTADVMVLDEVFSQREYVAPDPVASSLNAQRPLRVADLGANIGAFGAWIFANYPDAQVVAFEPDQGNAAVHERAIAANDLSDRWRLLRYVAAERAGRARPAGGDWTTATFEPSESGEVEAVDVFPYLAEIDWLKMDIEGGEWPILADERFARIGAKAVVLEYHERGCPADDPQAAATAALRQAGFTVFPGVSKPRFGAGLLWGLRSL